MSLVEVEPSMSSVSKVTDVAARSAASAMSGVTEASVVRHTNMVANEGAIMPAPFPMPPIVQPSPWITVSLTTISVVMMASAAAVPSVG